MAIKVSPRSRPSPQRSELENSKYSMESPRAWELGILLLGYAVVDRGSTSSHSKISETLTQYRGGLQGFRSSGRGIWPLGSLPAKVISDIHRARMRLNALIVQRSECQFLGTSAGVPPLIEQYRNTNQPLVQHDHIDSKLCRLRTRYDSRSSDLNTVHVSDISCSACGHHRRDLVPCSWERTILHAWRL